MVDVLVRGRIQLSRRNPASRLTPLKTSIPNRVIEPEILDDLSASDPRAIASRRDLQRLNVWLGHWRIINCALRAALSQNNNPQIIEIGCGDGTFAANVLRPISPGEIMLVDRQATIAPQTINQLTAIGWKASPINADIFQWLPKQPPVDCIYTNLFLHHFEPKQLRELFSIAATKCRVFIACEPRRSRFAHIGSYLLTYLTCSAVTRHDAPVSVRAGFANNELSSLWPADDWTLREEPAGISSHLFIATRQCQNQSP